jgi:hypothetical protein
MVIYMKVNGVKINGMEKVNILQKINLMFMVNLEIINL